jgi:glycosyltransferase involved in cell wall biosynthesis
MNRIAIISNQAFSLINFRSLLIIDLVKAGFKVYAFAPDYDDVFREKIINLGAIPIDCGFSRAGMNPFLDIGTIFKLSYFLITLKISVTLSHSIKPVIFGSIAAWMSGISRRVVIIEGLGHIFTDGGTRYSWRTQTLRYLVTYLYKISLKGVQKVIFLNVDDLNEFLGLSILNSNKAVVLGGIGVDLDEWSPVPIVTDPITFLLAARILKEKGVIEFTEAARKVKCLHPRTRFILLGSIDINPSAIAKSEVEAWVEEGFLEWPGNVSVKSWLAQASVFVLPSYREGVPRSTQEAMALGRPVITTNVPGCRDTVEEGLNGYLVSAKDSYALFQAMLRFVHNPALIKSMGVESRKMAEARFDAHQFNACLLKIIYG